MADVNVTTSLVGLNRVLGGIRQIGTSVGRVARLFGVAGTLGSALSGATFLALGRSVADTADRFDKMSDRIGVSVEALAELDYAAKLSGLRLDTVTMAMQRMTRRVSEAAQGTGEARNAIKELGLNAKDLAQLAPEEQLREFAERLQGVGSQADRVRIAMRLFDSEGVAMLQMLKDGRKGLDDFAQAARDAGVVMDQSTVDSAVEFKDTLTEISEAARGAIITGISPLIKPLGEVADKFKEAEKQGKLFSGTTSVITETVKALAVSGAVLGATWDKLVISIGAVIGSVQALITDGIDVAWQVWKEFNARMDQSNQELADSFERWYGTAAKAAEKALKEIGVIAEQVSEDAKPTSSIEAFDALQDELAKVKKEMLALEQGERAARAFELTQGRFKEATDEASDAIRRQILNLEAQMRAMEAAKEEAKELSAIQRERTKDFVDWIDKQKETAKALREGIDPQLKYNNTIAEYEKLKKLGLLTEMEFLQVQERARDEMRESIRNGDHLNATLRESWVKTREYEQSLIDLRISLKRAANPMIEYTETVFEYIELLKRGWIDQRTFNEAVKAAAAIYNKSLDEIQGRFTKWQQAMLDASQGFGTEFTEQLDRMLSGAADSWKDFQQAIFSLFRRSVLDAFITQPLQEALRKAIEAMKGQTSDGDWTQQLGAAASLFFRSGGNQTGDMGAAMSSFQGDAFAGQFASGGVLPRGFVGLVGEKGPEFIAPQSTSRITPNSSLGGGIVINQNFSAGVSRAELAQILPRLKAETVAAVREAKQRGGSFSRAF